MEEVLTDASGMTRLSAGHRTGDRSHPLEQVFVIKSFDIIELGGSHLTRHDFLVKWGVYALAPPAHLAFEGYFLTRLPVTASAACIDAPLAVVAVGRTWRAVSAGPGLAWAWVCCAPASIQEWRSGMPLGPALVGLGAGLLAQYVLRQNRWGCLVCALLALAFCGRRAHLCCAWPGEYALGPMLRLTGMEIGCSLPL